MLAARSRRADGAAPAPHAIVASRSRTKASPGGGSSEGYTLDWFALSWQLDGDRRERPRGPPRPGRLSGQLRQVLAENVPARSPASTRAVSARRRWSSARLSRSRFRTREDLDLTRAQCISISPNGQPHRLDSASILSVGFVPVDLDLIARFVTSTPAAEYRSPRAASARRACGPRPRDLEDQRAARVGVDRARGRGFFKDIDYSFHCLVTWSIGCSARSTGQRDARETSSSAVCPL